MRAMNTVGKAASSSWAEVYANTAVLKGVSKLAGMRNP
jgi:hypothetical protein